MIRDLGIYEAESVPNGLLESINDIEEIQTFLKQVAKSRWWRARSGVLRFKLLLPDVPEMGAIRPRRDLGEIYVHCPCTLQDLCHEITHVLTWRGPTPPGHSDHRSAFLRMYVEIVEQYISWEHACILARNIAEFRVYGYHKADLEEWP